MDFVKRRLGGSIRHSGLRWGSCSACPPGCPRLDWVTLLTIHQQSIPSPPVLSRLEWVSNLTLTHTWLPALVHSGARALNGVSWSLCYEEQFYVLCAFGLILCPRRFVMLPLIVTAVVLPLVTLSFIDHRMILETVRGTFVGPKWLQFAVGGLLYYRLAASPARMGWAFDGVLWALPGCRRR